MEKEFILPEKWFIRSSGEFQKWLLENKYLHNIELNPHNGYARFYSANSDKELYQIKDNFLSKSDEITFKQFLKYAFNEKDRKTQYVTREAISEIFFIICTSWKNKTYRELSLEKNLFLNKIEVPNYFVKDVYSAVDSMTPSTNRDMVRDWVLKYLPKPKVLKTVEVVMWMNIYMGSDKGMSYPSQAIANSNASPSRIACVELKGTYQIEE